MGVKIFCYAALIVAFLLSYQKNPVYTLIIITIAIGALLFYKSKKNKNSGQTSFLFSGKPSRKNNGMSELTTLILLQRFLSPGPLVPSYRENDPQDLQPKMSEKELKIEQIEREILDLLQDD